jgi:GTP-binding protein
MPLPMIAIVGRPNVGKSSLFNSLVGRRVSIVDPTPGVTRDRVSAVCDVDDAYFELVDTGGYGIVDRDDLGPHIERQIRYAIDRAQVILFVVDAREGLTPLDRQTAELLRKSQARVRLLANKVDEPHMADAIGEFARLGFGEPVPVSAATGGGRWALLELIRAALPGPEEAAPPDPAMKIAIVGKRNAGKSSFINALAEEERVIVSEVPGTTRDAIDVQINKDGRPLVVIDTAGVRKKNKLADDVEHYSYLRVLQSIERADVVLFLIDSTVPIGQVDKKLAHAVAAEWKPCVLVVNKWDLAKNRANTEDYGAYLAKVLPHLAYAPVAFTSAAPADPRSTAGRNVAAAVDLAASLFKQSNARVGTGRLNHALQNALQARAPKTKRGRKSPKFYYATQVSARPPTLVVFVNSPQLVTTDYERFLLNRFRESLPFSEIPIRLVFKPRRESLTS